MSVDMKLILLGPKNAGKTSIFNRFVYDEFTKTSMTVGAYFGMKQHQLGDQVCNLAIWDTAGEEKFDSLTSFYCRNARIAIICFDLTESSLPNLDRWVQKVQQEAEEGCAVIVVGNKLDVVEASPASRHVSTEDAKAFAKSLGCPLMEVSAKTGANVTKMFDIVVDQALRRLPPLAKSGGALSSPSPNLQSRHSSRQRREDSRCCWT